jgi:hypothetical protein
MADLNVIRHDAYLSYHYAYDQLGGRFYDGEPAIMKDPYFAVKYAVDLIKGPWIEAESYILMNASSAYIYARDILKRRWAAAEPIIIAEEKEVYEYAKDLVKGRWQEAEKNIKSNGYHVWHLYLDVVKHSPFKYTEEDKFGWLQKEGFTEILIEVLNYLGMCKDTQEYIVQNRPDLIAKIKKLDPQLKIEYCHELSLAGIEI